MTAPAEPDTETVAWEQLSPPCDANEDCEAAAAWVLRLVCGCVDLCCPEHKDVVLDLLADATLTDLICLRCVEPAALSSVVPL